MWPVVQCLWCFSQEQGDTMGSGNKPVVTPCLGQYLLNETSQHIEVVPPFHAELLLTKIPKDIYSVQVVLPASNRASFKNKH